MVKRVNRFNETTPFAKYIFRSSAQHDAVAVPDLTSMDFNSASEWISGQKYSIIDPLTFVPFGNHIYHYYRQALAIAQWAQGSSGSIIPVASTSNANPDPGVIVTTGAIKNSAICQFRRQLDKYVFLNTGNSPVRVRCFLVKAKNDQVKYQNGVSTWVPGTGGFLSEYQNDLASREYSSLTNLGPLLYKMWHLSPLSGCPTIKRYYNVRKMREITIGVGQSYKFNFLYKRPLLLNPQEIAMNYDANFVLAGPEGPEYAPYWKRNQLQIYFQIIGAQDALSSDAEPHADLGTACVNVRQERYGLFRRVMGILPPMFIRENHVGADNTSGFNRRWQLGMPEIVDSACIPPVEPP